MTPQISIIMAAYNASPWIQAAIASVQAQEGVDWELVVVDDGSQDDTADRVQSFKDSRIRLIQQENQGQSAALNRGITEARGDYIKFLDADDALRPGHLQAQIAALSGHQDCVADCRWGYFVDHPEQVVARKEHTNRDYDDPLEWLVDSLTLDEGMMGGWKWLISQQVLAKAGGWNPKLSLNNDFDFSIRVLLASQGVRHAPAAVYAYRKTVNASLSGSRGRRAMDSAWLTTKLGCDQLLEREDSPRIRRICANRHQMWLFQFYPEYPDLADQTEQEINQLGGSELHLEGGRLLKALLPILGWKTVRRLQTIAYRRGWSRILKQKEHRRIKKLSEPET